MRFDYRMYGTVKGISPEKLEELRSQLPFETVRIQSDGLLDIDHEGDWVDVEPALDALCAAMEGENVWGSLDVIDDKAWTVTRYRLTPEGYTSATFDVDNVMEGVRTS